MKRERVELRSFGKKLKEIRLQHKLTQEMFADKMNVSLDTVKNWEQGYNYPSIDMLVSIAAYFRCDFDYLIGQQETPSKEYAHIADMIGISEKAAALFVDAKEQCEPITWILSELIENKNLLFRIYSCSTADYGGLSTPFFVADPFQPDEKRGMLVTPESVERADMMDLYYELRKFVGNLRKKCGLPTSEER